MINCQMTRDGNKLIIVVDLSREHGPSKSGHTTIIATTNGNAPIAGTAAKIGLNIYTPKGLKALY